MTASGDTAAGLLGESGPFAGLIEGFAPRAAQQAMAEAVEAAIEARGSLLVEAGTGVGKTYAYLVPALRSGRRVVISTGTRHLQDQLFLRDLPQVERGLGRRVHAALLKGRANYLCLHRLRNLFDAGFVRSPSLLGKLVRVDEWARHTETGDLAELAELPENDAVRPMITSTVENCLGSACPLFDNCFVLKARQRAQEADVVVVNHHLFVADLALKEEGFGEILPSADAFIVDEAHQLPDVAGLFLGETVSSRQLRDLARDVEQAHLLEAGDMPALRDGARALEAAVETLHGALEGLPRRESWPRAASREGVARALAGLGAVIEALAGDLETAAPRGKELQGVAQRAAGFGGRLAPFVEGREGFVTWYERLREGFRLSSTPLDISESFRRFVEAYPASWVFTSATLAVGDSFDYFRSRLGLAEDAPTLRLESPFDFAANALLFQPKNLPEPRHPEYTRLLMEAMVPVIEASGGRAFLLFTSYRALNDAAAWYRAQGIGFPLLVQGESGKRELLADFRAAGDAVLMGTQSFWEGVDVRGEALSLVMIDKLPFAAPNDPVLRARLEALEAAGANPFFDYQIPQAAILLKQGVGRLIRDPRDRGVLVVADPRLRTKGYGRTFRRSLPPMPETTDPEAVRRFFGDDQRDR